MSEPDFMYPGEVADLIEALADSTGMLAWQHEQFEPDPHKPHDQNAVRYHIEQAKNYRDLEIKAERLLEMGKQHPMGLLGVLFDLAKNEQQEALETAKKRRMTQETKNVQSGS